MAFYRCGGGGIPSSLKTDMNAVYNKKFGTSTTYDPSVWASTANLMGPLPERTATGSIAHITDGADEVPIKSWEVDIDANLSGVSSVVCTQTGLQIADFESNLNSTSYGCTIEKLSGGGIRFHGTTTQTYLNLTSLFDCEIKSGISITLSRATARPYRVYAYLKFEDNTTANVIINQNASSVTYTTAKKVVQIGLDASGLTASTEYDETIYVVLQYGSTAHSYEPYIEPKTYSANLGRTIYGGQADIVNGEGHSTRIKKTVRWGDLGNVTQLADVTRKEIVLSASETPKYITASASTDLLNDKNLPYDMTYSGNFEHIYIANTARIWVYLPNGTDADTEITVFYTLADALQTDFTFPPITPTPETALGVNNFWADEGDTEVTYRADINLALGGQ